MYHTPWAGDQFGANFPVREGDFVWVSFENGDLEYPIWHSGNFAEGEVPEQIKTNKQMGFVSRDKHYDVIDEEAKSWKREMASGSSFEMAEKDINITSVENINTQIAKNYNLNVDENMIAVIKKMVDIEVQDAFKATITKDAKFDAQNIMLKVSQQLHLGADAGVYSVVWGEILQSYLGQFVTIFNAHNHTSPFLGLPTTPPMFSAPNVPPFIAKSKNGLGKIDGYKLNT